MKLKVLHVIPSVAPCRGGPSKAIVEMVYALNNTEDNIQCEIATTNDACANTLDAELNVLSSYRGTPIRFFARFSPPIRSIQEFQYSASFAKWLKENIQQYDLLHIHAIFSYCSSYAMWLARKKNIPYVVRPIGQLEDWSLAQSSGKKNVYLSLLERRNLKSAARVHFTSVSEQQQALHNLPELTPMQIPLGIFTSEIIPAAGSLLREQWNLEPEQAILAFVSRIHPKKGLETLFDALAEIKEKQFTLIIAGDGETQYIEHLKHRVQQLNLQKNIQWAGFVKGHAKDVLLQGADLFVLTSHSENFGIAVLEALAVGTPCLVTKGVALATEIEREKIGYVAEKSSKSIGKKLTEALQELENSKQGGSISIRAVSYVQQNHQWNSIAKRITQEYQKISAS